MEKNISTNNGAATMNNLRHRWDNIREVTDRAYHVSEDFVRRYPIYSVLGAITLGAFLSGLVRRK